jgi:hypothetical protein
MDFTFNKNLFRERNSLLRRDKYLVFSKTPVKLSDLQGPRLEPCRYLFPSYPTTPPWCYLVDPSDFIKQQLSNILYLNGFHLTITSLSSPIPLPITMAPSNNPKKPFHIAVCGTSQLPRHYPAIKTIN